MNIRTRGAFIKVAAILLILFILLLLTVLTRSGQLLMLDINEAIWKYHNYSDYQYTVKVSSSSNRDHIYDVLVEVRNGQYFSAVKKSDRTPAPTNVFEDYLTINRVFNVTHRFARNNPISFFVTYQWWTGLPESIIVEVRPATSDNVYSISVTDFKRL